MYESPIDVFCDEITTKLEDGIFQAVQDVGVVVDKHELLKALQYDRDSYNKGFNDGLRHANEILSNWISRLSESGIEAERGTNEAD